MGEVAESTVKPALTAEEWVAFKEHGVCFQTQEPHIAVQEGRFSSPDIDLSGHALAATMLHEQPFGFTREMLNALHHLVGLGVENGMFIDRPDFDGPLKDLAHRALANLEALMPPVESTTLTGQLHR